MPPTVMVTLRLRRQNSYSTSSRWMFSLGARGGLSASPQCQPSRLTRLGSSSTATLPPPSVHWSQPHTPFYSGAPQATSRGGCIASGYQGTDPCLLQPLGPTCAARQRSTLKDLAHERGQEAGAWHMWRVPSLPCHQGHRASVPSRTSCPPEKGRVIGASKVGVHHQREEGGLAPAQVIDPPSVGDVPVPAHWDKPCHSSTAGQACSKPPYPPRAGAASPQPRCWHRAKASRLERSLPCLPPPQSLCRKGRDTAGAGADSLVSLRWEAVAPTDVMA